MLSEYLGGNLLLPFPGGAVTLLLLPLPPSLQPPLLPASLSPAQGWLPGGHSHSSARELSSWEETLGVELLLLPRAKGAGGTAGAAASLVSANGGVEESERGGLTNELSRPASQSCVSCCLANKSPGNLAPNHPNSSCVNSLSSLSHSSIPFLLT